MNPRGTDARRHRRSGHLVVVAGAAGVAFTDSLTTETGAPVVIVDRRAASGGHRNDADAFVGLHQPSPYDGVPGPADHARRGGEGSRPVALTGPADYLVASPKVLKTRCGMASR